MAGSTRFEPSSGSPDGPTFSTNYPNGQRGSYPGSTSLDRSGSFREGGDNRILSVLPSLSRTGGTLSHGEVMSLTQNLLLDPKAMAGQKFARPGELKRALASAIGVTQDEASFATFSGKPLMAQSLEELKCIKAGLHENNLRAKDRVKILIETISKLDKYCQSIPPRKRSRTDISLNVRTNVSLGGNMAKMGSQGHLPSSTFDLGPQKSEERAKNGVPNKRIRTSMVDVRMDVRSNALARQSGPMDRDRDMFRLVNGGSIQSEEKSRALPSGVDGWEKSKMKKKRSGIKSDVSTSTVVTRTLDGDREPKRGLQPRLGNDARSRLSNGHGFRSEPVNGAIGVCKLDATSQQNGMGMRTTPRNDQDSGSLLGDRRDRLVGSDKERATLKAINKPNVREDSSAASPTSITKGNAARAPRSGALPKPSPNIHRTMGTPDSWELPQCSNKLQAVTGVNNRKRSAAARSSSPPVTNWVGQRPQKISRVARRTNLVPVSSRDEAPASDSGANVTSTDSGLGFPRHLSSIGSSQQVKLKSDHVSPAGLSESEESGAVENKPKEKCKKNGEIDEKGGQVFQKVPTLVLATRKNKVAGEEDLGDGVRRQGRSGRGFPPSRAGMTPTIEKLENQVTAKQLRSARLSSDKIESKAGRPPTKKLSERKSYTRPRHAVNSGSSDLAGESDDDHEELMAAIDAALNASFQACSNPFWKQMELFFALVSAEDTTFLKEQVRLVESEANLSVPYIADQDLNGDLVCNMLSASPALIYGNECNNATNQVGLDECEKDIRLGNEIQYTESLPEVSGGWFDKMIPLSQRLLTALIVDDGIEGFNHSSRTDECFSSDSSPFDTPNHTYSEPQDVNGIEFDLDADLRPKNLKLQTLESFQTSGRSASNGFRVTTIHRYHDELDNGDDIEHSNGGMVSGLACTEYQYHQMSLDDRILLELHSIGLFPESVPDLAQREDEEISEDIRKHKEKEISVDIRKHKEKEISEDIRKHKEKLQEQIVKKKNLLLELEKAVVEGRELQERELERLALDKLVGMAYNKYMGCWGPNASGSKSAGNKFLKQAASSFVKRTLARCRKFEDTGRSCFSDPAFRDMLLSVSHNNDAEYLDTTDGDAANVYVDTSTRPSEIRVSAALGSDHVSRLVSRQGQDMDNLDRDSSDALQSVHHSGQTFGKDETWSNRLKKRELLLDDVVGVSHRSPSVLGSTLLSGTKGKRSERDREGKGQNREVLARNGNTKIGRPAICNVKGERKSKTKPRQKTAQLSASVNGLLGKASELPKATLPSVSNAKVRDELGLLTPPAVIQGTSDDHEGPLDLSHLQLPGIVLDDTDDLTAQAQDLSSWLNFDEEGMQDNDFMGLGIPMDDLSDLNMMV